MAPRYCSQCQREIRIQLSPIRNPNRNSARFVKLAGHDLCRQCNKTIMASEMTKQREARRA